MPHADLRGLRSGVSSHFPDESDVAHLLSKTHCDETSFFAYKRGGEELPWVHSARAVQAPRARLEDRGPWCRRRLPNVRDASRLLQILLEHRDAAPGPD